MSVLVDRTCSFILLAIMLARGTMYQLLRLSFQGWLLLGKGASVYGIRNVYFNGVVKIGEYALVDARFSKEIIFGDKCSVGRFSIVRASGSPDFISPGIRIGDRVTFGPYCYVGGGFGLDIGDDCIFGPYVSIHPEGHKFSDPKTPIRTQGIIGQGITIESNCWFGAKVCVLDRTVVSTGCVIASGAILAGGTLERDSIFAGIPARRLKSRFEH